MWDAAVFPFYASGILFGLYLVFKVSVLTLNVEDRPIKIMYPVVYPPPSPAVLAKGACEHVA